MARPFQKLFALLFIAGHLATTQAVSQRSRSTTSVSACFGRKVAVLDLTAFAGIAGLPSCNVDTDFKVDPSNGVVYSAKAHRKDLKTHRLGTHAAPWFLGKAIRSSELYTSDWEVADIVYVDDYCLYIKWLADVHTFGREQPTLAGQALDLAYTLLLSAPRWQRNSGADFVFYDPHPGFRAGIGEQAVIAKTCYAFANASWLLVDTPQRNFCPTFLEMPRLFVTPYAPNSLGHSTHDHLNIPLQVLLSDRSNLLYSRAQCHLHKTSNAGKSMRLFFSQQVMAQEPDVDVKCTNGELGGRHATFEDMVTAMSHSKFCMAFPGDAASTRRLSEVMLSGCIPVFPGPPYHSMPFGDHINWQAAGVFFNITDYAPWTDETLEFSVSPSIRSVSPNEARWWVPDAPVHEAFIHIPTAYELVARLRDMPEHEIRQKLEYVESVRSRFSFVTSFTEPPNAVNTLMSSVCQGQQSSAARH